MTDYLVSGAGTEGANGVYVYQTPTLYWKEENDVFLEYIEGAVWTLYCDIEGGNYYFIITESPTPPLTGWELAPDGDEPAPTLSVYPPPPAPKVEEVGYASIDWLIKQREEDKPEPLPIVPRLPEILVLEHHLQRIL